MGIQDFQKGEHLTAARLNELVRSLNAGIRGDGIIDVSETPGGMQLRLNVNALQAKIPQQRIHQLLFGKPKYTFTTGASFTLDPCDMAGVDNGLDDLTVYLLPDQAVYTMTNGTSISTSAIVPFYYANDSCYYMLGTPIEAVTGYKAGQTKTRNVWVLTAGSESDWQISSSFWAKITGSYVADSPARNRWNYKWEEVRKTATGYDGWAYPTNGRKGETSETYARNSIENMNVEHGVCGNGIDTTKMLDSTEYIVPAPEGAIVRMHTESFSVTVGGVTTAYTEHWFQYENEVADYLDNHCSLITGGTR